MAPLISVLLKKHYIYIILYIIYIYSAVRQQQYKMAKTDFWIIQYVSWFMFKIRLIFETSGF